MPGLVCLYVCSQISILSAKSWLECALCQLTVLFNLDICSVYIDQQYRHAGLADYFSFHKSFLKWIFLLSRITLWCHPGNSVMQQWRHSLSNLSHSQINPVQVQMNHPPQWIKVKSEQHKTRSSSPQLSKVMCIQSGPSTLDRVMYCFNFKCHSKVNNESLFNSIIYMYWFDSMVCKEWTTYSWQIFSI